MKRIVLFTLFVFLALAVNSQGLFKPVPANLFQNPQMREIGIARTSSTVFIPRLNTGIVGTSFGKDYGPEPFSAVGFGVELLRYKDVDGVAFNDFGLNAMYLKNTSNSGSGLGLFVTYNINDTNSLLNVGGHRDFFIKKFLFDFGVTFHY